jgi:hypothetical protein
MARVCMHDSSLRHEIEKAAAAESVPQIQNNRA